MENEPDYAAHIVLVSTALSPVTLSVLILLWGAESIDPLRWSERNLRTRLRLLAGGYLSMAE